MTASEPRRPVVLIVDDSPGVLRAMKGLLSAYLTVQVAENGTSALQALTPETDLVLSDIRMPGMDGLELMRVLRQGRPTLPVVLMTGVVEDGLRTRARDLGALDVLRKPLRAQTLLPSIQDWLSGQYPGLDLPTLPEITAPVRPGGRLAGSGSLVSGTQVPGVQAPSGLVPAAQGGVQAAQALLRPLLLLPGVMSAGLFTQGGTLLSAQGLSAQGDMTQQLGACLHALSTTAQTLGTQLDAQGQVRAVQLEFGDRVLVACFRPGETLAVLVRDTPAASSVKGWVRQRWGSGPTAAIALN